MFIYEESGLLGVSGISSDMRTLRASRAPRTQVAILYAYRGREHGSLAAGTNWAKRGRVHGGYRRERPQPARECLPRRAMARPDDCAPYVASA